MHGHQTALRDRAESLTAAFNDVQEQVQGLKAGITEFANAQNETIIGFKVEMEAARALAMAFSDSISSLNVVGISAILDSFWTLSQGVGVVVVVICVNWLAGKAAARIVATTCECPKIDRFAFRALLTRHSGFGLISFNVLSRSDITGILDASLRAIYPYGFTYSILLLAGLLICGMAHYSRRLVSKIHYRRQSTTLPHSTISRQHLLQAGDVEIKKEPSDLEA